jgi:hypothetical protein
MTYFQQEQVALSEMRRHENEAAASAGKSDMMREVMIRHDAATRHTFSSHESNVCSRGRAGGK